MIRNYLKSAFRNLFKHKIFSLINILGLAIGMACSMLIFIYVQHEVSYDDFHDKKDRIFRLVLEEKDGDEATQKLSFPWGFTKSLVEEYPEVEDGFELSGYETFLKSNNLPIKTRILHVEDGFFSTFTFPLISGEPNNVLREPNNAVISETFAKNHFPHTNPIGRVIYSSETYKEPVPYLITGVMTNIPDNSHIHADVVIADKIAKEFTNWKDARTLSYHHYILLSDQSNIEDFKEKLQPYYKKYNVPEDVNIVFQPVSEIHLKSSFEEDFKTGGNIQYIYVFSIAAFMILLIACINFINLSTARSLDKAKEVGVRKTLGAFKNQLVGQFYTESIIYILLGFAFAVVLVELLLPYFSQIHGSSLGITLIINKESILYILVALLLVAVISGAYPALFLSSQKPVFVLKKVLKSSTLNSQLRKALVVFQFSISIILLIATLVVYFQLNYISNKSLGFNKEHLIVLPNRNLKTQWSTFKQKLEQHHQIESSTVTEFNVNEYGRGRTSFTDPKNPDKHISMLQSTVDVDFIKTFQVEMKEGRFFSSKYISDFQGFKRLSTSLHFGDSLKELEDSRSIILNETAVNSLGLEQAVVGQKVNFSGLRGSIIGIIKDFHAKSMHHEIPPVVLYASEKPEFGNVFIRIRPENVATTLSYIEKTWKSLYPEQPFEFYFYEDAIQQLYLSEIKMGKLFLIFAFLGIFVACMGLLGLAIFSAEQRVKEIGIRKMLGASAKNIVTLLSKDFLKLVIIAVMIAAPVGYYLLNIWLENFVYKINISWWILGCAGAISIFIALLTISFQSFRAAIANPVESLRNE